MEEDWEPWKKRRNCQKVMLYENWSMNVDDAIGSSDCWILLLIRIGPLVVL